MSTSGARLSGRVAIVTGGARGIGRAYALRLARLGAAVVVVDRDLYSFLEFPEERERMTADTTVAEVHAVGGAALGVEIDLTDAAAGARMVEQVMERFGRIDVCVCNAGGGTGAMSDNRASSIDLDDLQVVIARNLIATINTCTPTVSVMRRQGRGKIVNVSSLSALMPRRDGGYTHYAAAKATIIIYTQSLARELGPEGITANVIAPGAISTGRLVPKMRKGGIESLEREIALRRVGTVDDCAGVLEFLATDQSDYVTGQVIVVDGGWSL
jgi:3-oxoacyl-[acyl-carrier protein] reductase